ncbi:hypothetical protein A3Q56_02465 [Intoshia linei]|uniref:Uncharacterized protein n=1 Tax=Intoshia linei TaxID=1819745 RepID=A0A177B6A5_9BILA|nr:hypothetical protein A3Q56_02465 [Intoshia linei]
MDDDEFQILDNSWGSISTDCYYTSSESDSIENIPNNKNRPKTAHFKNRNIYNNSNLKTQKKIENNLNNLMIIGLIVDGELIFPTVFNFLKYFKKNFKFSFSTLFQSIYQFVSFFYSLFTNVLYLNYSDILNKISSKYPCLHVKFMMGNYCYVDNVENYEMEENEDFQQSLSLVNEKNIFSNRCQFKFFSKNQNIKILIQNFIEVCK